MKVGFYAPYYFGEITHLACSLGDLARALGLSVSYLSQGQRERKVRDYWDQRVRSSQRVDFKKWTENLDTLVWFGAHRNLLKQAQESHCTNVLVPLWHNLQKADRDLLPEYDQIAAPCYGVYEALVAMGLTNVTQAAWYAGPKRYAPNPEPVEEEKVKLLINLEGQLCRQYGADVLSAIHILLSRRPNVEVTLAVGRQWTKGASMRLRALNQHTGRLRAVRRQSHGQRVANYTEHDMVFCPNVTSNTGYEALEALIYGCPVVAFDIPPYNEFIQANHNGALMVCDTQCNWLNAPRLETSANQLLTMFDGIASNPTLLERLKRRNWAELEGRARAFMLTWRRIWDC